MGCVVCCIPCLNNEAKMSVAGRQTESDSNARAKLERKLYIAKESPEPDFDLSDCELRRVPAGIYSICKVYRKDRLYLQENKLNSLEEGGQLADLYLVKVLNISSNRFTQINSDIKYLRNLTELYVHDNLIESLPETIQFLQCLQVLDVSRNLLRNLTPMVGKLKSLKILKITENKFLKELCPELCFATNIKCIELDCEQFIYPSHEICSLGTTEIMKFLCEKMNVDYIPPSFMDSEVTAQTPEFVQNIFVKSNVTWEEQEAAIIEQENKIHLAAKQQREKFMSSVIQEQFNLDKEIAKVQEAREVERQLIIKAILENEKEIECIVKNFIQSDNLDPEIIQQQIAYEQVEHDRLLEITRQNYDNIKKSEILQAMEKIIEEDYSFSQSKKQYDDSLNEIKQSMLLQELDGGEKLEQLLKAKDQFHTAMVEQLLEDQDIQKAVVASLVERVDAKSWSLNQEISLISSHLARLSIIEQEKRKLHVSCNYNDLLHQRVQLVNLLDDLYHQKNKRRNQLLETMKEMEGEKDKTTDFWLKNYQKLINSAPKNLMDITRSLDPLLANYLLQEGVIHCLPFLVKFLFSDDSLLNITTEKLKENGVTLSSDRKGIIRAINCYVESKSKNFHLENVTGTEPSALLEVGDEQQKYSGVVSTNDAETSILESECVICMNAKCEVVFVPCGHMCCCQDCAGLKIESCPMCRSDIERTIKVIVA